ncbi:T9SS type A sorting domain-containing protein [bacterium]|nr:T9SS type A sorting domain-containing protein [bacterium]
MEIVKSIFKIVLIIGIVISLGAVLFAEKDLVLIDRNYLDISEGVSDPALCDIDNDGDLDLFIGTSRGKLTHFRNDGSADSAVWTLVSTFYSSIDIREEIDEHSILMRPVFVDIDNDADYDLFIGDDHRFIDTTERCMMHYYENTGTPETAAWTLVTHDYMNLDFKKMNPDFADIDNDGDYDMFIGSYWGNIHFYRNDGTPDTALFTLVTDQFEDIDVSFYSAPDFVDYDMDGDLDLMIGESFYDIHYYRNDGTPETAVMTFVTDEVNSGAWVRVRHISPDFIDIDNDGDYDLFCGGGEDEELGTYGHLQYWHLNDLPELSWLGTGAYVDDGGDPDTATRRSTFTFRIIYADADNEMAVWHKIYVDQNDDGYFNYVEEGFMLEESDPSDTDVVNGKEFYADAPIDYVGDGVLLYFFSFADPYSPAIWSDTRTIYILNDPPILSWEGNAGYVTDGSDPDTDARNSTFTFMVTYSDVNDDTHTVSEVWIDLDDDSSYDTSEKFVMNEVDPGDTTYTDGKDFTFSKSIDYAGDGTLPYCFYFADDVDAATGDPNGDKYITLLNNGPTLDWLGSGEYTSDGVYPDSGVRKSTFTFKASYSDTDNDPAVIAEVWVDLDDDTSYDTSEKFVMTETNSGDTDVTDGKEYTYDVSPAHPGDGTLLYRFNFGDPQEASGDPMSEHTFSVTNTIPILSWEGSAGYTADGVDPDTSDAPGTFTFKVTYSDADDDAPTVSEIWIDLDDSGTYEGGEVFTMAEVSPGDTVYSDGKSYEYERYASYTGDGVFLYKFNFEDDIDTATGSPASDNTFIVYNRAPFLSWAILSSEYSDNGLYPDRGVPGTTFTFMVEYQDLDGHMPVSAEVWVDIDGNEEFSVPEKYSMTETSAGDSDVTDGKTYEYDLQIGDTPRSEIGYMFVFIDTEGDTATGIPADTHYLYTERTDLSEVKVYPNPCRIAEGSIKFSNLPTECTLTIYSISGEKVYEESDPETGDIEWSGINLKSSPIVSGVYLYVIKTADEQIIGRVALIR